MATKRPLVTSSGALAEIAAGDTVAPAALGSGTADSTTFLRGDNTWQVPAGGGGWGGNIDGGTPFTDPAVVAVDGGTP